MFFSIDFARWKSAVLPYFAYIVISLTLIFTEVFETSVIRNHEKYSCLLPKKPREQKLVRKSQFPYSLLMS